MDRETETDYVYDQIADHLELAFTTSDPNNVMQSTRFTIKNGSGFSIDNRHEIVCIIRLLVDNNEEPRLANLLSKREQTGWSLVAPDGLPIDVEQQESTIQSHGDADTDSCLSSIAYPEGTYVVYADIVVDFGYYVQGWSRLAEHKERKVFTNQSGWVGEPITSKKDFCYDYLSERGKQTRLSSGAEDYSKLDIWKH